METKPCLLCALSWPTHVYAKSLTGKRRLPVCPGCTTVVGELPIVNDEGLQLCPNCAHYKMVTEFDGGNTCVRCRRGPAHGAVGVASSAYYELVPRQLQLEAERVVPVAGLPQPPLLITHTENQAQGFLMLLGQLGAQQRLIASLEEGNKTWEDSVHKFKDDYYEAQAQVERLIAELDSLRAELAASYERNNELKAKLNRVPVTSPTSPPPVPTAKVKEAFADEAVVLEKLEAYPAAVAAEALELIVNEHTQHKTPPTTTVAWVEDAMQLMTLTVKDPVLKARVLKMVFEIHRNPLTRGVPAIQDHHGLGPKRWKARTGKVRAFYSVHGDTREVTIHEILRRAEAYTTATVNHRKQANHARHGR